MLFYYLFWMIMSFIIHFYIIFGTNLLTGGPTRIDVFFAYVSISKKRNIKRSPNGMKPSEHYFWNEHDPGDLEFTSEKLRGSHEGGGYPPTGRALCLVGPSGGHRRTSSSYIYLRTPKTSRSTAKHNFHHCNLLYPWYPILELSLALCRRGNQPRRASTSTSLPLRWVVSSLPQTYGSIVIS